MKKSILSIGFVASVLGSGAFLTACDEDTVDTILNILAVLLDDGTTISADGKSLGWLGNDEDTEHIEDDVVQFISDSVTTLPSKMDLTSFLPYIGDQGQFGTCVAWATAYNARTFLYAKANGLRTSQLNNSNTFSPRDIFQAIPAGYKNTGCQGTNIQFAFEQMISRGVATLSTAPNITSASQCDQSPTSTATSNAANYKIKSYREIDITNISAIKRYLAEGHLVVFGAKLGDEFMQSNDATVLTNQTSFNTTGMHAYHAIVCAGYDDSKGSNGAFRVVNSWGTSWGDSGYIWVDYKFFCGGQFANCGFVAYDLTETVVDPNTNTVTDLSEGQDLVPLRVADNDYNVASDPDSDNPTWRTATYDVYNAGDAPVSPSSPWAIAYVLYNAYDASEYQVVLFDLYTDALSGGETNSTTGVEYNGFWSESEALAILGVKSQAYSWTNATIKAGESTAHAVYGSDEPFEWSYKLPSVSGSYYLVLMADAFGGVAESNEENNYYFLTASDGSPLTITNGVIQGEVGNKALRIASSDTAKPKKNAPSPSPTAVSSVAPNAYSPAEIAALLNHEKATGRLANKALQWADSAEGCATLTKGRRIHSAQ